MFFFFLMCQVTFYIYLLLTNTTLLFPDSLVRFNFNSVYSKSQNSSSIRIFSLRLNWNSASCKNWAKTATLIEIDSKKCANKHKLNNNSLFSDCGNTVMSCLCRRSWQHRTESWERKWSCRPHCLSLLQSELQRCTIECSCDFHCCGSALTPGWASQKQLRLNDAPKKG